MANIFALGKSSNNLAVVQVEYSIKYNIAITVVQGNYKIVRSAVLTLINVKMITLTYFNKSTYKICHQKYS